MQARQAEGWSERRHILVVDDDELVLALTCRMLRMAGYATADAVSARQALDILEAGDRPVDLVLTDVVMPETDGRVLGQLITAAYPGLPVAYMSAYAANDVFHRGSPFPNARFLAKPFSPDTLLAFVEETLEAARMPKPE